MLVIAKKKPEFKQNDFASVPTSMLTSELIKEHEPKSVNRRKKMIESEPESKKCGLLSFLELKDEVDEYSIKTDKEILKQFTNIGLSRYEYQIYLAIFDIYTSNCNKDYEKPILISIKDFHTKVLGNKNRLRKENVENYDIAFCRLSTKYIKIDTSTANVLPYKKRDVRDLKIESIITNIALFSTKEYTDQLIKIFPTEYMILEAKQLKQISNYMPREFITLNLDQHDNILFFGYYLVKMHKINKQNKSKDNIFSWNITFDNLIKETLPSYDKFRDKYNIQRQKKQFLIREIIKPLTKALDILVEKSYITKYKLPEVNTKIIFDESKKIEIIFNYDKAKIINLNVKSV